MATRNCNKSSWFGRNTRHQPHNRNNHYYKYFVGLCAIIIGQPAFAAGDTSVAANPQASISGAVANQAVQINQGSLSTQSFSRGHYCNGTVVSFTPYLLQTQAWPGDSLSINTGAQVSFSMPLDTGAVDTCKRLAQVKLEKERLDYELVRIKECIGIYERGYTIVPGSPFYQLCSDVAPIASVARATSPDSSSTEEASFEPAPAS